MSRISKLRVKCRQFIHQPTFWDQEMRESFEKRGVFKEGKTIMDQYYTRQLNENQVLLLGLGHNVRGNLMYILDELNHNACYSHLEIYVRTFDRTDAQVQEFITQRGWNRTKTVVGPGPYGRLMETAKYLLTEVYFPEGWIKRDGQVVINIWHGTPLKKLGLMKNSPNIHKDGNTQKNFIAADYLLYPNEYTRERMLESYKVRHLMRGKAVMLGYPRTTGILDQIEIDELKKKLASNGERIYAYMPTWKDYLKEEEVLQETESLLCYLDEHLKNDQILYVNLHHKVHGMIDYSVYQHIRAFPNDVDSYRLLAATDALISDYSSVFFDYLASGKNIVLYCHDLDLYEQKRGTYFDMRSLPFHMAESPQEVIDGINAGKTYNDDFVRAQFNCFDSIDNARKLCRLFVNDVSDLQMQPISGDFRSRLLLFSEQLRPGKSMDMLMQMHKHIKKEKYDPYISCDADKADAHRETIYPFLYECSVIGLKDSLRYDRKCRRLLQAYLCYEKSFKEIVSDLMPVLRVNFLRLYGTDQFDHIICFDTDNAELLLMLNALEKPMVIIISSEMYHSMRMGNRLLIDALRYILSEGKTLYVLEEGLVKKIGKLLKFRDKGQIKLVKNVSELEELL